MVLWLGTSNWAFAMPLGGRIFERLRYIGSLLWQLVNDYQGCLGSRGKQIQLVEHKDSDN